MKDFSLESTCSLILTCIAGDVQERYNRLERQIAERSNMLQMTRMQCLSLRDSLHSLLIWLEEKENTFDKLEKASRLMIKRSGLMEQIQQHKVM